MNNNKAGLLAVILAVSMSTICLADTPVPVTSLDSDDLLQSPIHEIFRAHEQRMREARIREFRAGDTEVTGVRFEGGLLEFRYLFDGRHVWIPSGEWGPEQRRNRKDPNDDPSAADLETLELQRRITTRAQFFQILENVMKKHDDAVNNVTASISGGGRRGTTGPIKRIEFAPGPATSVVYGADAESGVINVVSEQPAQLFDMRSSWLFSSIQRLLNDYSISLQSVDCCDVTHGSPLPFWAYQKNHDIGLPKFSSDGSTVYFGSVSDGFDAPGLNGFFQHADPSQIPAAGYDPELFPNYDFDQLDQLRSRINNDPDISDAGEAKFQAGLELASAYGGGMQMLSDQAFALGTFDPDAIYQDVVSTDADASLFSPDEPVEADDVVRSVATPPATSPFADFAYPPAYAFDFSACPEKRSIVLALIQEREDFRATVGYYMDHLRSDDQTTEQAAQDFERMRDARQIMDDTNAELRTYWEGGCPEATAQSDQSFSFAVAESDSVSPSGDPTFPRIRLGDLGGYTSQGPVNSSQSSQAAQAARHQQAGSYPRIRVQVNQQQRRDDGSVVTVPADDIAVSLFRNLYGESFPLPHADDVQRDSDLYQSFVEFGDFDSAADAESDRGFTDENGVAEFMPVDSGEGFGIFYQSTGNNRDDDAADGVNSEFPESRLYVSVSGSPQPEIGSDGDSFGTNVIGVKLRHEQTDSVTQQFAGKGGPGVSIGDLPKETLDGIPPEFLLRADNGLSIGKNFYLNYNFAEYLGLDLNGLDDVPGQTGWSNNFCGDSALPPQGAGYLTADMSPVKSVDDQWVMERVNVPASDSAVNEFADPVIVGVIDTGLDWFHPDFNHENIWRNEDEIPDNGIDDDGNGYVDDVIGWNFMGENNKPWDHDGHGTFVAGIIAADPGNDAGIDGINPNARIMVLKALNNFGRTRASYVAQAIVYGVDNGAKILNLSVAGPGFPKVVQDAVNYANSKGVLVIMAAGNRAEDIANAVPDRLRRVMMVAATGPDDKRAVFSNVGDAVNIAAPGIDVVSLRARRTDFMYNSTETTYVPGDAYLGEDNLYYRATGTSFATPIVSGVASLVWGQQPGLSHVEVQRMLEQSAHDVETPGRDRFTGYGIVDAQAALAADPAYFIHADIPSVRQIDVGGQAFLQVAGAADANLFARGYLEIGQGEEPQSWTRVGDTILDRVRFGELGRIPGETLEGANTWTIRLVVEHATGKTREARYVVDVL